MRNMKIDTRNGTMRIRRAFGLGAAALGGWMTSACAPAMMTPATVPLSAPVTVAEAFTTPRDTLDNIDSPAVWHGPNGENWLLATAKTGDVIVISDAATGRTLRRASGPGTDAGRMERPNGIAVMDDLAFVVERDNRRVQLFRLPEMTPVGTYGMDELVLPYGIAVRRQGGGYTTWVTDNYEQPDETIPPDSALGRRVREYRVTVADGGLRAELVRTFGDTGGAGVLRVVESIAADPQNGRLLIAEENPGESALKVYSLDGRFTGAVIPPAFFPSQAEGIVMYACGPRDGYWIATDQSYEDNVFHVFDRRTLAHRGSFTGPTVRNTDGVALTQTGFGPFEAGAFYAVHDDGNVAAFSWSAIADALGLRKDCTLPAR
jgi:3-phytase